MLESLENRLLASGVLLAKKSDRQTTNEPKDAPILEESDQCIQFSKASTDRRVKAVEEQNAVLKAENRELREQLRQYKFLDEHLSSTGRSRAPCHLPAVRRRQHLQRPEPLSAFLQRALQADGPWRMGQRRIPHARGSTAR